MKFIMIAAALAMASAGFSNVEDRLMELETNSQLNPLRFGAEFMTRVDTHDTEVFNATTGKMDSETFLVHRMRFRLNMEANPTPKLSFYARISGSKLMSRFTRAGTDYPVGIFNEEQWGRNFRGSALHFERAFFNYKLHDKLTLSVGRLPTIEGGPEHLTYGSSPLGTYPLLAYGSVMDGYALTTGFGDVTIRGIYHPLMTLHFGDENDTLTKTKSKIANYPDVNDIYVGMIDYSKRRLGFARSLNFVLQYLTFKDSAISDAPGASGTYSSLKMGYDSSVLYAELTGIAKTGLNLALTYHATTLYSDGNLIALDPAVVEAGVRAGGVTNQAAIDAAVAGAIAAAPVMGFLTDKTSGKTSGSAQQVVISYKIPSSALKRPTVGLELFSSDQNYMYFDFASLNLPNMHAVRGGKSMHLFYVQPLDTNLKLRIGMITKERVYSEGLGFGKIRKLSEATGGKEYADDTSMYLDFNMTI